MSFLLIITLVSAYITDLISHCLIVFYIFISLILIIHFNLKIKNVKCVTYVIHMKVQSVPKLYLLTINLIYYFCFIQSWGAG